MSRRLIVASSRMIAERIAKEITEFHVGRDDTDDQLTAALLSACSAHVNTLNYFVHRRSQACLCLKNNNCKLTSEEHLREFNCSELTLSASFLLFFLCVFTFQHLPVQIQTLYCVLISTDAMECMPLFILVFIVMFLITKQCPSIYLFVRR